jgi:Flp pilus assembly pilin Flp
MRFPSVLTIAALRLAALSSRFSRKEGQTLVEYALVLCVLTIAMIACFTLLGNKIIVVFSAITNILDTAQSSH